MKMLLILVIFFPLNSFVFAQTTPLSKKNGAQITPEHLKVEIQEFSENIDKAIQNYELSERKRYGNLGHGCNLGFYLLAQDARTSFEYKHVDGEPQDLGYRSVYSTLYFECIDNDAIVNVLVESTEFRCTKSPKNCEIYKSNPR